MTDAVHDRFCALCWADGVRSKAVDHWPHVPMCQEHLTDSLVRTRTVGWNVVSLADIRTNETLRLRPLARDRSRDKGARRGSL
jgi:hypothetical protein